MVDASRLDDLFLTLDTVVDAASFSLADKQKLTSLVQAQQGSDDDHPGSPAAAAYKRHSTNILEALEDPRENAGEQLSTLRMKETNIEHNYNPLKHPPSGQIAADTKERKEEAATKSATAESKATAEEDLAQTVKDLAEAKENLGSTNSDCTSLAANHGATAAGSKEELQVIATAKKILTETSSGGVEETYLMFQFGARIQTRADLAGAEVVTAL
jgi:hypothetical protein